MPTSQMHSATVGILLSKMLAAGAMPGQLDSTMLLPQGAVSNNSHVSCHIQAFAQLKQTLPCASAAVDCLNTNLPEVVTYFSFLKAFACLSQPPDQPLHVACT